MGWHLDGRVTAVLGTHTHVPTADARVLPGGTAYITDVGMTGARGGVLGVKRELAVEALVTPDAGALRALRRGPVADGRARVSASAPLRADAIEQLLIAAPRARARGRSARAAGQACERRSARAAEPPCGRREGPARPATARARAARSPPARRTTGCRGRTSR